MQVHGLFGSRSDWQYVSAELHEHLRDDQVLLYVSEVNEYRKARLLVDQLFFGLVPFLFQICRRINHPINMLSTSFFV